MSYRPPIIWIINGTFIYMNKSHISDLLKSNNYFYLLHLIWSILVVATVHKCDNSRIICSIHIAPAPVNIISRVRSKGHDCY